MKVKISNLSRGLMLSALPLLSLAFFFPLWRINLWAPQYPEGLSMQIWLSQVTGDLANINILNHYIGMHPIVPDDLPELRYFTWIFLGLVVSGLLVVILARRPLLYLWTALLIGFSSAALTDFYLWEYKFGHDLNPDAAIIMEGESYQPPLIGTKTLMNIEATSWPAVGGYGHIGAVLLSSLAVAGEILNRKRKK